MAEGQAHEHAPTFHKESIEAIKLMLPDSAREKRGNYRFNTG